MPLSAGSGICEVRVVAARLNIALVEDNADFRGLLSNILHADGHRVSAHESAEYMLEQSSLTDIDLFIVDINLPGEDGLSLVRRLRQISPQVDIIMVTAMSDLGTRVKGYESGADLYLVKPIQIPELIAALRRFARRKSSADASVRVLTLTRQQLLGELGEEHLTSGEAVLLTAFAHAPAGKLDIWQLASLLDIEMNDSLKSSLAIRIARLRKKLVQVGGTDLPIQPVRNFGYQLTVPVRIAS